MGEAGIIEKGAMSACQHCPLSSFVKVFKFFERIETSQFRCSSLEGDIASRFFQLVLVSKGII